MNLGDLHLQRHERRWFTISLHILICAFFSVCFFIFRFDFDTQAISPPAHDDSFFYIRYPTGGANDKKQSSASGLNSISEAITTLDKKSTKSSFDTKNMVQHTEPCKKILNNRERGKCLVLLKKFIVVAASNSTHTYIYVYF